MAPSHPNGDLAEWVDFAYWWSCIGKSLRQVTKSESVTLGLMGKKSLNLCVFFALKTKAYLFEQNAATKYCRCVNKTLFHGNVKVTIIL